MQPITAYFILFHHILRETYANIIQHLISLNQFHSISQITSDEKTETCLKCTEMKWFCMDLCYHISTISQPFVYGLDPRRCKVSIPLRVDSPQKVAESAREK